MSTVNYFCHLVNFTDDFYVSLTNQPFRYVFKNLSIVVVRLNEDTVIQLLLLRDNCYDG